MLTLIIACRSGRGVGPGWTLPATQSRDGAPTKSWRSGQSRAKKMAPTKMKTRQCQFWEKNKLEREQEEQTKIKGKCMLKMRAVCPECDKGVEEPAVVRPFVSVNLFQPPVKLLIF